MSGYDRRGGDRVRVGFIPLVDCALLVVAAERGFAEAEGIDLELIREISWANIRDRIIVGQFDCAHMLTPMPIASTLGLAHLRIPMVAPVTLAQGGNCITVSIALYREMQDAAPLSAEAGPMETARALGAVVAERKAGPAEQLTFATVFPFSGHTYELRYWLACGGIDPDQDVRLIVLPPALMVDALSSGRIDGFCVGAPWNSVAVAAGAGAIVATKAEIWSNGPEKVLGMRADVHAQHPDLVARLVRAIVASAEWAAARENRADLAALLAAPAYLDTDRTLIENALAGTVARVPDGALLTTPHFLDLAPAMTRPDPDVAVWIYSQMVRWAQTVRSAEGLAAARTVFRPDIYAQALGIEAADIPVDRLFFDGRPFLPDDLDGYLASFAR